MTNKVHISQQDDRVMLFETGVSLLGAGASLVGAVVQVSGYSHLTGFVYSDVASALGGIIIEQGLLISDFPAGVAATTHVTTSNTTYTAADIVNNAFSVQIVAPFARIIYINGAGAQSEFRLAFEARVFRGL